MASVKKPTFLIKAKKRFLKHGLIFITIIAIFICGLGGLLYVKHVQRQHQIAVQKAKELKIAQLHQKELGQVSVFFNQVTNVATQYSNIPSSTTKTKDEWDSYYKDLIAQLHTVLNSSSSTSFMNNQIVIVNKDIQSDCDDFINALTIDNSATDMQFQIDADKSQLSSDQSTLANEESIYNQSVAGGFAIPNSYVTEFQGRVASDNTELSLDQQTSKSQKSQQADAGLALLNATSQMNIDFYAAGGRH